MSTRVLLIVAPQTSQMLAHVTELVGSADWVNVDRAVVLSSIASVETS